MRTLICKLHHYHKQQTFLYFLNVLFDFCNILIQSEEESIKKLEDILTFATGCNALPPIAFSPQPSLEFLHQEGKYPVANTCINCLRLPIHKTYDDFKLNMDFAVGNSQGFGLV